MAIELSYEDSERLARAIQRAGWPDNESGDWCLPSEWDLERPPTPWLSTVVEVLTELQAMGYTLSKRIPVEGKVR